MVRLIAVLAALLAFAAGPACAQQAAYVHDMSGSVTGTLNSAARALKTGDVISAGTVVSTGERSRAVIKFEDGQVMVLAERSSFRIVEYRYVKERVRDSSAVFALLQGGLRFISGVIGSTNRSAFRMTAGTATIGIRGTDVSVIFDPATQSFIASVGVGEIEITRTQGTQILGAGETAGEINPVNQLILDNLLTQRVPINLPVSVQASAAAAAAAAEADRLIARADGEPNNVQWRNEANAAIAAAQKALAEAIAAALEAYNQALQGGAIHPAPPLQLSGDSPTGSAGAGGGGGTCTKKSVSPC